MRRAGVLLHPTSLPGRGGIGTLGASARDFIRFLRRARVSDWQVLPLGPTALGNSPYMSPSAFAGNPLLLDPDDLIERGWLAPEEVDRLPPDGSGRVDFGALIPVKRGLLDLAAVRFAERATGEQRERFEAWCARESAWLDDYALFESLSGLYPGLVWQRWPVPIRDREPGALSEARASLGEELQRVRCVQFLLDEQWAALRREAREAGIEVLGDAPIFVAGHSADVWANRDLFRLGADGFPTHVAGVPPDYFSTTGQLWGNPLYDWDRAAQSGYAWWTSRIARALQWVDRVRIDHFRGLEACWEIPAGARDARSGRWAPAPGRDLLLAMRERLGGLPVVAEDLGVITPEVEALRDEFALPGMKVLHFAFGGGADNPHLPHNLSRRTVLYCGTHDNDSTLGWFHSLPTKSRRHLERYLDRSRPIMPWSLIRLAFRSVAELVVVSMQDLLALGSESRMNTPGVPDGNWAWRLHFELDPWSGELADRVAELCELYGRSGLVRGDGATK